MNSFEERLSAALADAETSAPAVPADAGREVFQDFVRGRRRRQRLTVAMRLTVVTIVAGIGAATMYTRVGDAPADHNTPAVTTDDPGQRNVGQNGGAARCYKRSMGGCQLLG